MTEPTPGNLIAQTFAYVADVYAETALFMKDLKAAPALKGFTSLTGNANGHNGSRSLDLPRQWLPRFISGIWVPGHDDRRQPTGTCLAASVLFFNLADQAIDPVVVYGLIRTVDQTQATFPYWSLWDAYFNKDKAFRYGNEDGSPIRFWREKGRNESYLGPRSGTFATRPLTAITGVDAVWSLAAEMLSLWASESA